MSGQKPRHRLRRLGQMCGVVVALVCPPAIAGEFLPKSFDLMWGSPDMASIFPGPDPILVSPDDDILNAVISSGESTENFNTLLDKNLPDWQSVRDYEHSRDLAIAYAAAERPESARDASEAAMRLAPAGSFEWWEARLLRALIEMRLSSANARAFLDAGCASADSQFAGACSYLEAIFESQFGSATQASASLVALRSSRQPLSFPIEALPHTAQWDAIRAALYDVLRHRYGAEIDIYGRDQLEQSVAAQFYLQLRNKMTEFGPASTEAGSAIDMLVQVEIAHTQTSRATFWLDSYRKQVLERLANRWEDMSALQFANDRDHAVTALMAGDRDLATTSANAAVALIEQDTDVLRRQVRMFYLASALDVPGQHDLAASMFQDIWSWASTLPPADHHFHFTHDELNSLMPAPPSAGQAFTFEYPAPLSYERPDVLQFAAGIRLMLIAASAADLPTMERYRIPSAQLADAIDAEAGTPLYSALLRVVTADAIRSFGTSIRLAEAKTLLESVGEDLDTRVNFPSGEPAAVLALWNLISRKIDSDLGTFDFNVSMPVKKRLEWRYQEALGRTEMAMGELPTASADLQAAFQGLIEEAAVGGRPVRQAKIALDLAALSLQLGNDADLETWSEEAMLGVSNTGASSLNMADILSSRAAYLATKGDLFGAEIGLLRATGIRAKFGRTAEPKMIRDQFGLARIYEREGDARSALDLSLVAYKRLREQPTHDLDQTQYADLESLLDRLGGARHQSWAPADSILMSQALEVAQFLQSSRAGLALQAAQKRAAAGDPNLRAALQQYGELQRRREALVQRFADLFGRTDSEQNLKLLDQLNEELAQVDDATKQITGGTSELLDPPDLKPIDLATLKRALAPRDAMVVMSLGATKGWAWVITADKAPAWYDLGDRESLLTSFATLRCQIMAEGRLCDQERLSSQVDAIQSERGVEPIVEPSPLDFSFSLASEMFDRLLGPARDLVASHAHLIVVTDNLLSGLPLQVLQTAPLDPDLDGSDRYRQAHWLVRSNSITVLPMAASIVVSGGTATDKAATRFLGIGDPAVGEAGQIDCAVWTPDPTLKSGLPPTDALLNSAPSQDGYAIADTQKVKRLARLPDTRCELESIAASLETGDDLLLLQANATETRIKAMSEAGQLENYRIIAFATHGLVSGDLGLAEPALVLTPPQDGTALDDGLLTASEVAGLHLSADWVVLSACNTAASDGTTSETLSGLARAFFYAGARSLLVSGWPVFSEAAARLTTATFRTLREDTGVSRSEALRRAMERVITDPLSSDSQLLPYYWAPFSLVGGREY